MSVTLLKTIGFTVAVVVGAGLFTHAFAQKPVTQQAAVTITSVVEAIDSTKRLVTLKHDDGTLDTIYCGPEVKRFDALEVGDTVTFEYYESMVYAIQKPGDTPPADAAAVTRTAGVKPGGTMSQQMTTVVTVKAIDMAVPSVSITSADGRSLTFKVEDKNNLEGVEVGDKIQITYTQALAISVATPTK
jgi:Cu/Ag efflux protein CusF